MHRIGLWSTGENFKAQRTSCLVQFSATTPFYSVFNLQFYRKMWGVLAEHIILRRNVRLMAHIFRSYMSLPSNFRSFLEFNQSASPEIVVRKSSYVRSPDRKTQTVYTSSISQKPEKAKVTVLRTYNQAWALCMPCLYLIHFIFRLKL